MFEARLLQASILKKLLEAIKDLVTDGNFECNASGINLQAMDSAHVSLVALLLRSDGFEHFRCDRNLTLGINLSSMAKVLRLAGNEDIVTIKAEDDGDVATFMFESKDQKRVIDNELKLIDIDNEHLGIPDTDYSAVITMSSSEFQRIIRDLSVLGDSVTIEAAKEGVKFSVSEDVISTKLQCLTSSGVDVKQEDDDEDKKKKSGSPAVSVELQEPVTLTFALRYLNFFCKAAPLSDTVTLSMHKDVPVMVEFRMEDLGYIRYYLAPKIDSDD